MNRLIPVLFGCAALTVTVGCDEAKDALEGGEQTSYCEALCDWAVECADGEREVDIAALSAQCLEDTRASDAACAEAEAGTLDTVSAATLSECTDAVAEAAAAGECGGFTGSIDELKIATTPAECGSQGADAQETFTQAQSSTAETNDELCERFTESFCTQIDTCVISEIFGDSIPSEVIDLLGTPLDLCIDRLSTVTDTCIADGLYGAEEDLSDVNTARQSARECLTDIEELTCDQLFSGEVPKLCGGSFTDTETALTFFEALAGVAIEYQDAASE